MERKDRDMRILGETRLLCNQDEADILFGLNEKQKNIEAIINENAKLKDKIMEYAKGIAKIANESMQWKKLADEKPTECGEYLIASDEFVFGDVYDLEDVRIMCNRAKITHWMLIQHPKSCLNL